MKRKVILSVLFFIASLPAFAAEGRPDPRATAGSGLRRFGFNLFQKLYSAGGKDPLAISPLSIGEALTLATRGSEKETQQELTGLFLNKGEQLGALSAGLGMLRNTLADFAKKSEGAFEFTSANALWGNTGRGFEFTPTFLRTAKSEFGAELRQENFASAATLENINGWVAKQTRDRITKLIKELKPLDVAVLLNAVYAKGKFSTSFNTLTEGDYKDASGTPHTATYLTKREHMGFYEGDKDVTVFSFNAEAPIRKSGAMRNQVALDILVAKDGKLETLVKLLDGPKYLELVTKLEVKPIELTVPAVLVEQKNALSLKNVISNDFNVKRPFDSDLAQFKPMGAPASGQNIFISDILTKTFYEVTPFGFEAAAATAVVMAERAIARPDTEEYAVHKIESAAVHVIRHIPTGTPLFIVVADTPVHYDLARITQLVEEGYKHSQPISAQTKDGTVSAGYDKTTKDAAVILKDAAGKETVLKALSR